MVKILDAGCGTGYFSDVFQQQGAEVTALDLSSGMLEVARKKAALNILSARIWKRYR